MATLVDKVSISFFSAILFALISLPQTYQLTKKLLGIKTIKNGCPTFVGHVLHTIVFFIVSYLSMGGDRIDPLLKVKFSLYGTLIFYFLSSPAIYAIVGNLFGTSSRNGCPSVTGVILHAFVYMLALVGVMYLPPE